MNPHDEALAQNLQNAQAADLPTINVSPNEGKLLYLIAKMAGAKRVLEIGTLGGYSTTWLARALPADGKVITLELDQKHAEVARQNLDRAGVADRVEVRVGRAVETLRHDDRSTRSAVRSDLHRRGQGQLRGVSRSVAATVAHRAR